MHTSRPHQTSILRRGSLRRALPLARTHRRGEAVRHGPFPDAGLLTRALSLHAARNHSTTSAMRSNGTSLNTGGTLGRGLEHTIPVAEPAMTASRCRQTAGGRHPVNAEYKAVHPSYVHMYTCISKRYAMEETNSVRRKSSTETLSRSVTYHTGTVRHKPTSCPYFPFNSNHQR